MWPIACFACTLDLLPLKIDVEYLPDFIQDRVDDQASLFRACVDSLIPLFAREAATLPFVFVHTLPDRRADADYEPCPNQSDSGILPFMNFIHAVQLCMLRKL